MANSKTNSAVNADNNFKFSFFNIIEHPADIGINICAVKLEEAFENAAKGMFSIICDIGKVKPQKIKKVQIRCNAEMGIDGLLVMWLEKLLYLHEINSMLFCEFKVQSIITQPIKSKLQNKKYILEAIAFGEEINFSVHELRLGIKAPTYHKLSLKQDGENGNWLGTVIFDV